MADVWGEIAGRIREHAKDGSPSVERYTIKRLSPLLLDQIDGDNVLEDGDDDFVVGKLVKASPGLAVGDVVRVLVDPDGDEYMAIGVDD
jgi:hypothetical protein